VAGLALLVCAASSFPQQTSTTAQQPKPDAAQQAPATTPAGTPTLPNAPVPTPKRDIPPLRQQPKRILGIMPNYRAVSAGAIPPPPGPRRAFLIATENSFDYSAFVFVGVTSLLAEGSDSHPQLGKGVAGFGRYYWRGWLDKTSGNYMVVWALPSVLHEDERFYAKGEGSAWGRGIYAASRVLITPNYQGHNTFNGAEIVGRGISQAISISYYPSSDRTAGNIMEKYGYAIGRDALTNTFREFWPDIAAHLKRHKSG
jgi:hypothetical protein